MVWNYQRRVQGKEVQATITAKCLTIYQQVSVGGVTVKETGPLRLQPAEQ